MIRKSLLITIVFILSLSSVLYAKKVIGVTAFKNLTRDKSIKWLEIGIADSISHKLRNIAEYIVVDRTNVDKIVGEVQLGQSGLIDDKTAKKAGKALGADIIVVGNFQKYGKKIRISAKLVEVESHKILKQVQSTGVMDNIFVLQDQIALKIINQTNLSLTKPTNIAITKELKLKIFENFTTDVSAYEYYAKGQKFYINGNHIKAIDMFKKAVSTDSRYSLAYSGLSKAYANLYWKEWKVFEKEKDNSLIENSYKYAKKALKINPDIDEAHLSLARYYQHVEKSVIPNKWKLCEKETKRTLKINPNNGEAYYLLSRIYGYNDKKEEKYLKTALEKNKFLVDAHLQLGILYHDQKKYKKAEKYFLNTIEIEPKYVLGYSWLGYLYNKMKQIHKAIDMYKKALIKYPKYVFGMRNLGIHYRELKQYDHAMEQFKKVISINKNDYRAWNEIAYVYQSKNQYHEAVKNYKISLKYKSDYYYSLANIGYSYGMIGKYTESITYLKKAHNLHQKQSWPASHLGWIYRYKLKNINDAKYWYREALKRDPNNSKYKKNLSELSS